MPEDMSINEQKTLKEIKSSDSSAPQQKNIPSASPSQKDATSAPSQKNTTSVAPSQKNATSAASSQKDATSAAPSQKNATSAASSQKDATSAASSQKDATSAASSQKDATSAASSQKDATSAAPSQKDATSTAPSQKDATSAAPSQKNATSAPSQASSPSIPLEGKSFSPNAESVKKESKPSSQAESVSTPTSNAQNQNEHQERVVQQPTNASSASGATVKERTARTFSQMATPEESTPITPMSNPAVETEKAQGRVSQVPKPSDVDYTPPLIQCLVTLFKLHGKSVSSRLLVSSLPKVNGPLHPSAAIRAAQAAGMKATTLYRPMLSQVSNLTLPCILLLQGDKSCVLVRLGEDDADVIFPENESETRTVSRAALEKEYLGYTIYAKPEAKLDKRASELHLLNHKRWFWSTLLHFLPIYKHVFGASIVINMLAICGPLFFMNVYDKVVPNHATDTLWVLALGIGIAYIFDFILRNLRSYFVDVAGRNADIILASKLMQHLLALRLDAKPDSTGSLANNLREFESLREFFGSTTLMAIVDLPFLLLFISLVFLIGGPIGFVPLIAVPLIVCAGIFLQFPLQQITERGFKENMQKNALLVEIINGLETIKTTMAEGRIQTAWENVVSMSALSNSHSKRMANLSMTLTVITTQLVSVFIIIWGVYRITDGSLSMGGLIACNMLAGRAMAPLSQIASMLTRLQQSRMALKSLDLLMALDTEKTEADNHVDFGPLEHSIALEEVSFKYPGSEQFAMERVNIYIKPGEKVGIIGRMGSGKSTLGRLCVGLYQPTEGSVKFGGVDIRQLDMVHLRSRVGYVSQDNYLFYGTVRENISFGAINADDRMVLRAANIAGVTDFIRSHPAGFGMPVGERGMSLSGGQRQSVAIARALLADPDVLILDEPSSNMDNSSELVLKQRLAASLGEKSLILVTHRLSMLDLVERLVVMDAGRIIADGPKNAVLNALRNEQLRLRSMNQATSAKSQ